MGTSATAHRRSGFRSRSFAGLAAVAVSLAAAPVAWADPPADHEPVAVAAETTGGGDDASQGAAAAPTAADTQQSAANAASSGPETAATASEDGQAAADTPANAANNGQEAADKPKNSTDAQTGNADAQTGNGTGNANANGNGNASANGNGSGNGNAGGNGNGNGNADAAPGHAVDQGATVGQSADASASADQKHTGNGNQDVRVDKPGNGPKVEQGNETTADAGASATTTVGGEGPATVTQDVSAEADAGQSDVSNTSIVVRVGSNGDDAGVSQVNAATGSAVGSAVGGDDAVVDAQATATQQDASNTSVSVRVFSPGYDGPVSQSNVANASANASGGAASEAANASQDGVRNTNVSIRVESPGGNGEISQQNTANAAVSTPGSENAVAVTSDAVNTSVAVNVAGAGLDRPGAGGLQVWEWDWTWNRDESQGDDDGIRADVATWNWSWDENGPSTGHGTVTKRNATASDGNAQGGSWSWSWNWERSGVDDWNWDWDWQNVASCDGCIWVWNWSWSWTGTPTPSSASTATPSSPMPPTGQLNASVATATAAVSTSVGQTATQSGGPGGQQFAGQLITVDQVAVATATANQVHAGSIAFGGGDGGRLNLVRSDASSLAAASAFQDVEQILDVDDDATGTQWSGQDVEIAQIGSADSTAAQLGTVLTDPGRHDAAATAAATSTADVAQQVVQDGLVGGGSSDQWAGQLTVVEQLADASSTVAQTGTPGSRHVGGTANASAKAANVALVEQSVAQSAARVAGRGEQDAEQLVLVAQDAGAEATTAQLAGTAGSAAHSDALAVDMAAVEQTGLQDMLGASDFDRQELLQQSIVSQTARAASTSTGGIAGAAVVVNCAVSQQGASQVIGAAGPAASGRDLTEFCFPSSPPAGSPATPPAASPSESGDTASATLGSTASVPELSGPPSVVSTPLAPRTAPKSSRARLAKLDRPDAAPHGAPGPGSSRSHPAARPAGSPPALTESSSLPSTQARLDTRPGSDAGAGDAGREPPLPPAGDPPMWVSALAAAASGAGPSGIAAISPAFVLVPPLVLRAREGSVVRRPATVFAPVDVPV